MATSESYPAAATPAARAAGAALLTVDDVHTYYGDSYVLQGLSLAVPRGQIVALLGRNGMGKTTLIRSIAGLTPPRAGTIVFDGVPVSGLRPHAIAQRGIGLVPQGRRTFPSLTVRENLLLPTSVLAGRRERAGHHRRALDARDGCCASSPTWPSGPASAPGTCRAASNRCWRSAAPSCRIRGSS